MNRQQHDCAWACALHLVEPVAHLLRDEEQNELFARYYETVKAALEAYDIARDRRLRRLGPLEN